ncbi:hypothetical protein J1N10_07545 [Carboxylicivirga sp. A043]|uniref:hypothetical protein n=1 Tax=Carboxylicivirga litoralis TaxID=2816963 RepID=UPI0021CB6B99|nr:hypothetical protein [Carboxylicivirga sp. A043]MCU4155827.1 hypothetical protein [Carboxylicivirga sp. A043]
MKKEEIPQDKSTLENFTKEVYYVKGKEGRYETGLSKGWSVKAEAQDSAWDDIHNDLEEARLAVKNGKKSPIFYYMKKELMDEAILASYVGMMKFRVKRHFKPWVFKRLKQSALKKYASVFKISVEELKSFEG